MKRNRWVYVGLIILTMILGLLSRKYGAYLPDFISKYSGDTLWALMVFFIFGLIFNKDVSFKVGFIALLFSFAIEFSQLYQVGWLNNLRNTTVGALILGHGFLPSDLICYTVGISIGIALESPIKKLTKKLGFN